MAKKRVLFLHTLPSPYRNPLFERLDRDPEYDTVVYFMAKGAKNRVWKNGDLNFKHKFLPELTLNLKEKDDIIPIWNNPTVPIEIARGKFDLVVCSGWDSVASFLARITCWLLGIPMIIWAGSTANEKSWRRTLAYLPVRLLVNSCTALIAYGAASRDYLLSLGAKKEKVFISNNSVDVDFYRKTAQQNSAKKQQLRKSLGIKNKNLVIFVGQLISRKGALDLYRVIEELNRKLDVGVLWVGYGPLENKLKSLGKENSFNDQYFVTTRTPQETAKMYSMADLFVLPTYEDIYSNVVPEALASGLPVVTTHQNGVSVDYLREGENGFVINAGDIESLKEKEIGRAHV